MTGSENDMTVAAAEGQTAEERQELLLHASLPSSPRFGDHDDVIDIINNNNNDNADDDDDDGEHALEKNGRRPGGRRVRGSSFSLERGFPSAALTVRTTRVRGRGEETGRGEYGRGGGEGRGGLIATRNRRSFSDWCPSFLSSSRRTYGGGRCCDESRNSRGLHKGGAWCNSNSGCCCGGGGGEMSRRQRLTILLGCGVFVLVALVACLGAWLYIINNRGYVSIGCDMLISHDPSSLDRRTGPHSFCRAHDVTPASSEASFLTNASIRVASIGDWGRDGWCCQRDVAQELAKAAEKINVSAILNVGDNFYPNGLKNPGDAQVKTSFSDIYLTDFPTLRELPWIGTLGNHDCTCFS